MRFGIDVDAIVADTVNEIVRHLNGRFALTLRLDDVVEYYVDKWLGDRPDLAELRTRLLYESEFYDGLPPLAGAVEGVRALAATAPICFITARPPEFHAVTTAWLSRHGFPTHAPVYCCEQKATLAAELGLTHFVEDSPGQAQRLAQAGLTVFLFAYPWNRHLAAGSAYAGDGGERNAAGRLVRVQGWPDVLSYLGLARQRYGHP